jgi:hypothetical protein
VLDQSFYCHTFAIIRIGAKANSDAKADLLRHLKGRTQRVKAGRKACFKPFSGMGLPALAGRI